MKKLILLSIAFIFSMNSNAQLKTYSGNYKLGVYRSDGKATYTYKEVNDERIKEGKFSYNFNNNEVITITGEFKDNKKTGHWKLVSQGQPNSNQNLWISNGNGDTRIVLVVNGAQTTMEGNYVDGVRDGKWTCSKINAKTGSNYKSEVSFLNGKFFGNYTCTYKAGKTGRELNNVSINGQFVEGGLPDGKWTAKWTDESGIDYIFTLEFDKGKPISHKKVDQSTGEDVTHPSHFDRHEFFDNRDKRNMQPALRGIKYEKCGEAFPFPFRQALSGWCVDEAMFTTDRNQQFLFLDWE